MDRLAMKKQKCAHQPGGRQGEGDPAGVRTQAGMITIIYAW
jgi:hypothetical protein